MLIAANSTILGKALCKEVPRDWLTLTHMGKALLAYILAEIMD